MYGARPATAGDSVSEHACMLGYIRDVLVQLKRGLAGWWVAHAPYVRVGIALASAYHIDTTTTTADNKFDTLHKLLLELLNNDESSVSKLMLIVTTTAESV